MPAPVLPGRPGRPGSVALVLAVLLGLVGLLSTGCAGSADPLSAARVGSHLAGDGETWLSGASGAGVATGAFGRWRGAPVQIAGTWNDDASAQVQQWTLRPGAEYGAWTGDLDVAVGGIFEDRARPGRPRRRATTTSGGPRPCGRSSDCGPAVPARSTCASPTSSTATTTRGPCTVTRPRTSRRPGAGSGPCSSGSCPASQLVFCPNAETSDSLDLDWRDAFPGADEVDVDVGRLLRPVPLHRHRGRLRPGARGHRRHRRAPRTRGAPGVRGVGRLPFAVSEWSTTPMTVTAPPSWPSSVSGWPSAAAPAPAGSATRSCSTSPASTTAASR